MPRLEQQRDPLNDRRVKRKGHWVSWLLFRRGQCTLGRARRVHYFCRASPLLLFRSSSPRET